MRWLVALILMMGCTPDQPSRMRLKWFEPSHKSWLYMTGPSTCHNINPPLEIPDGWLAAFASPSMTASGKIEYVGSLWVGCHHSPNDISC